MTTPSSPPPETEPAAAEVTDLLFTWPNLISFSRIFVAFPIIWLHQSTGGIGPAIIVLAVYGILSDYLDGWMARRTGTVSELGKVIDPIADKTCAIVLFSYSVWIGMVPLWFFLIVLVRDALILGGSLWIRGARGKVAMSVVSGKVSVNALAAYWLSVFFFPGLTAVHLFFMGSSLSLMIFSFIDYFHRFKQIKYGAEFR